MDQDLTGNKYRRDLVHLNEEGDRRMGARLLEWILATERIQKRRAAAAGNLVGNPGPNEPEKRAVME